MRLRRSPPQFRWIANQGKPCITTKHDEGSTAMVAEEGPCTIGEAFDDDAENTGPIPLPGRLLLGRSARGRALLELTSERDAQEQKWGPQSHPDGTHVRWSDTRDNARRFCDEQHQAGTGTWLDILLEEVYEAAAETDPVKLRTELVQTGAVIVAWLEDLEAKAESDV